MVKQVSCISFKENPQVKSVVFLFCQDSVSGSIFMYAVGMGSAGCLSVSLQSVTVVACAGLEHSSVLAGSGSFS